jgi:hypothetical protein
MTTKIKKGTEFRASHADSNPKWRVVTARGRFCETVGIEEDNQGVRRGFLREEVERLVSYAEACARMAREHDDFYSSLKVGSTVHYHNGFGQWVRCVATLGTTRQNPKEHVCLTPLELVGAWREYDLRPDRYLVKMIRDGGTFEPNYTNLWEAPNGERRYPDPTGLSAVELNSGAA